MEKAEVDKEYENEIEKARRQLRALIYNKSCAPLMLRLAWQDACTYDLESKIPVGPNGSIRSEQELEHSDNKGLKQAVQDCEDVKGKLRKVSYADLYQLAGIVAVEVTGGPTIDFLPGRMDSKPPQEGRLWDSKETGASHLRDILTTCMGLSDQDIVALYGGHVLGKAYEDDMSGNKGEESSDKGKACKDDQSNEEEWTGDPFKFDNSYFVELLKKNASLLKLFPADIALIEDKKFRKYVEKYAKDEDAFFKDYAIAHKKLSELGCDLKNSFPKETHEKLKLFKPKLVIPMVIAPAVMLGYLRSRKNNQLKR